MSKNKNGCSVSGGAIRLKFVECEDLAEGKTVQIGDIIFVGTKTQDEYKNKELKVMKVA